MKTDNKLFYYKTDIIFVSDGYRPEKDAQRYLREQTDCCVATPLVEISSIEQLAALNPSPEWLNDESYIWGVKEDITAKEFLNRNNEEYQLYLKLKQKYEE